MWLFSTLERSMTSDEIRHAIKMIQQTRGRLKQFSQKHDLSYDYLFNVANGRLRQLGHDTALNIIAALKHEQQDEIVELEQRLASLKAATDVQQSAA
jgi:hypothetical protein